MSVPMGIIQRNKCRVGIGHLILMMQDPGAIVVYIIISRTMHDHGRHRTGIESLDGGQIGVGAKSSPVLQGDHGPRDLHCLPQHGYPHFRGNLQRRIESGNRYHALHLAVELQHGTYGIAAPAVAEKESGHTLKLRIRVHIFQNTFQIQRSLGQSIHSIPRTLTAPGIVISQHDIAPVHQIQQSRGIALMSGKDPVGEDHQSLCPSLLCQIIHIALKLIILLRNLHRSSYISSGILFVKIRKFSFQTVFQQTAPAEHMLIRQLDSRIGSAGPDAGQTGYCFHQFFHKCPLPFPMPETDQ